MKKPYAWIIAALSALLGGTAFAQQADQPPGGQPPTQEQDPAQQPMPGDTTDVEEQDIEQQQQDVEQQQQDVEQQQQDVEQQQQDLQQRRQEELQHQQQDQDLQQQQQPQGATTPQPQRQQRGAAKIQAEGVELSALDQEQIMELQRSLQEAGYYTAEIDGQVGRATKQALRRFYSDQAQAAAQGKILPQGAAALGLDEADIERVRGEDQQQLDQPQPAPSDTMQPQQIPDQQPQQPQQPQGTHDTHDMQDTPETMPMP